MQLQGRTVLITGGRRVGGELALLLARHGMNVALSYFRSREVIEARCNELQGLGIKAIAIQADLRDPKQAELLVDHTIQQLGSLDVLVNMASEFHSTPFETLTPDEFQENLNTNLAGPYYVAIAASRAMLRNQPMDGVQGKIIFFADWAVDRPYRGFLPYLVAKGGIVTLARALAVELAPTIAVNAISPAMIDPPPHLSPETIEAIRLASPLQRIGIPSDANRLVLYLLEGTDFVTGANYRVDGGRFLGVHE